MRQAILEAIENNDYEAWKSLMEEKGKGKITEIITEENFAKFVEMHQLMQEGKYEEAKELRKELGLGIGRGPGAFIRGFKKGARHCLQNQDNN